MHIYVPPQMLVFKLGTDQNFFEPNCLQCRKMPLQQIGEVERVQYEGKFLPLLPPRVGVPV